MSLVAALYVDRLGPYPKLLGPEMCWDEERDARTYEGPWPVVAHPPCGPWGRLKHMAVPNRERRHADKELGPIAVEQVRAFGGVLEQPEGSALFDHCGLPRVGEFDDAFGGSTWLVEQVHWGHPARKATILYLCRIGTPRGVIADDILAVSRTGRVPTHWVSGGRKRSRKGRGGVVPPGIKVCSAQQRRRTPVAFAEWLISLAATATVKGATV